MKTEELVLELQVVQTQRVGVCPQERVYVVLLLRVQALKCVDLVEHEAVDAAEGVLET